MNIETTIDDIERIAHSPEADDDKLAQARQVAMILCADFIRAYNSGQGDDETVKSKLVDFRDALEVAASRHAATQAGEVFKTLSQEV
jgi:hypothetical protein